MDPLAVPLTVGARHPVEEGLAEPGASAADHGASLGRDRDLEG